MNRGAVAEVFSKAYVVEALMALVNHAESAPMTLADLKRKMGPSQQKTASGMVRHLTLHGLVWTEKVPGKKRPEVYAIHLTAEGMEIGRVVLGLEEVAARAARAAKLR